MKTGAAQHAGGGGDPTATRLYIVSAERRADDVLDVVARAEPALAKRYGEIRSVTPTGDLSLRSLRRGLRPGRDRVLYDFTRPSAAMWAAEVAKTLPGAVLCGARRLPLQTIVDPALRRARRRYSGLLRDSFSRGRLGALDADIPAAGFRLGRPKLATPPSPPPGQVRYACAFICVADGGAEAYGAIKGWLRARTHPKFSGDAQVLLSVASPEDEAHAHGFCQSLQVDAADVNVIIERRKHRADLAAIAGRSDMLIDLDRFSWAGTTDALAVADAAGIPHMRVTSFLSDIAPDVFAALTASQMATPVSHTSPKTAAEEFTTALVRFIEAAQQAPLGNNLRMGAAW